MRSVVSRMAAMLSINATGGKSSGMASMLACILANISSRLAAFFASRSSGDPADCAFLAAATAAAKIAPATRPPTTAFFIKNPFVVGITAAPSATASMIDLVTQTYRPIAIRNPRPTPMPMSRGKMGDQLPPGDSMIGLPNHDRHRSQLATLPMSSQMAVMVPRNVMIRCLSGSIGGGGRWCSRRRHRG